MNISFFLSGWRRRHYISPKIPAKVFLKFFIVSSVSSNGPLFCCVGTGPATIDPWRLKFAFCAGWLDWWLVTLLSETTRFECDIIRMCNDISIFCKQFYLRNLVLLESPVVLLLVEDQVLEDPYLPILASIMINRNRISYNNIHVYSKTKKLVHF